MLCEKYVMLHDYGGEFYVEREWLIDYVKKEYNSSLDDFINEEYTLDNGMQIFEDGVTAKKVLGVQCPLCSNFMRQQVVKGTIVYICETCPGILYKHHTPKDYSNLGDLTDYKVF